MTEPPLDLTRDPACSGLPLGPVVLPGSKSMTNRALVLAAQAPGVSCLLGGLEAEDTRALRGALRALGLSVVEEDPGWRIEGGARPRPTQTPLWLGASGTSLRFLLPWLALQASGPVVLEGEPRLFERPLAPLLEALAPWGVAWSARQGGGCLHPARKAPSRLEIRVRAEASSQFLTGLALAAAGLPEGGRLAWEGVPSFSYLHLTQEALARFGCEAALKPGRWEIPGGCLRPVDWRLPADWSGAAAFLCAAAVTGRPLRLEGVDPADPQGDRALVDILAAAGCRSAWEGSVLEVSGPLRRGIEADLEDCPDLAPVLAAAAALAPGPSRLMGLETLPLKECDRLEACIDLVQWLGGRAEAEGTHALRVQPGPSPDPHRPPFDPRRDHRMAFAAAVGALRHGGRLKDPGCVAKTFPGFWEAWARLLSGPAR